MRNVFCLLLAGMLSASAAAAPPAKPIKATILDLGWLECDANWMVAMLVVGTKANPRPPARWIKVPVYAVLIDHAKGKLLYDTGCSPAASNENDALFPYYHGPEQTLVKQLSLAHARPEEIKTLVLSHLHMDHAGNVGLLEHAQIYVHKRELEQALASGGSQQAEWKDRARRCRLIDRDQEIVPGVTLVTLPGHAPGVLGLMVELKNEGVLFFTSDAAYTRANYGPPARLPGIVYDSLSFFESIEKVRRLAREHHARVMFPHDMEFFQTLKTAPRAYE